MVSKGLVCLYILEKVEIWSGDTDASHTDSQTTEYRATQLVSSIKHKLSHAMTCFHRFSGQLMVFLVCLVIMRLCVFCLFLCISVSGCYIFDREFVFSPVGPARTYFPLMGALHSHLPLLLLLVGWKDKLNSSKILD